MYVTICHDRVTNITSYSLDQIVMNKNAMKVVQQQTQVMKHLLFKKRSSKQIMLMV